MLRASCRWSAPLTDSYIPNSTHDVQFPSSNGEAHLLSSPKAALWLWQGHCWAAGSGRNDLHGSLNRYVLQPAGRWRLAERRKHHWLPLRNTKYLNRLSASSAFRSPCWVTTKSAWRALASRVASPIQLMDCWNYICFSLTSRPYYFASMLSFFKLIWSFPPVPHSHLYSLDLQWILTYQPMQAKHLLKWIWDDLQTALCWDLSRFWLAADPQRWDLQVYGLCCSFRCSKLSCHFGWCRRSLDYCQLSRPAPSCTGHSSPCISWIALYISIEKRMWRVCVTCT